MEDIQIRQSQRTPAVSVSSVVFAPAAGDGMDSPAGQDTPSSGSRPRKLKGQGENTRHSAGKLFYLEFSIQTFQPR